MGIKETANSKTVRSTKIIYSIESTKGLVDNRANIQSLIRRITTWLAAIFAVSCMPSAIG